MEANALELRVLMGLQAGARASVAEGRHVLGTGDEVDIVLAGPRVREQHATLTVANGRATLAPVNGALVRLADGSTVPGEIDLVPGQAVDCDGVWIAVAPAASPWPDPAEILAARAAKAAAQQAPAGEAAQMEGAEEAAPGRPAPAAAAAPAKAPPKATEKRKSALAGALVPLAAALVLLLIAGGWLWRSSTATPAKAEAKAAPRADPAAAYAALVRDRIAGLGLGERLAAQRAGGTWTLVGTVSDEAQRDRVRQAFADVRPAPVMRIYTEEETSTLVAALISRLGLPVRFALTGPAKAKLTVAAPSTESAEQVAQAFREELPGVRELETEFVTPASLAPALQDLVNRAGLGGRIRVGPAGPASPHLAATGAVDNAELARWNQVVAEFHRRHGDLVAVRPAFTRLTPTMPFTVRAVLDGPTPHVLTADGERIFEGGRLRGYRLVDIGEREIVFDGPERVSIARPAPEAPRAAAPR